MKENKAPHHRVVVDRIEFNVPDQKLELVKALLFEVATGAQNDPSKRRG